MTPARWPRADSLAQRLLFLDPQSGALEDLRMRALPVLLRPGDVLVVNDAATLPASLQATTSTGEQVEVRLAGRGPNAGEWTAALLGRGDWRTRTEERGGPFAGVWSAPRQAHLHLLARGEIGRASCRERV